MELECVSFSDTPNSGRSSKIKWDFTSSSRARTLIRIFFINKLNSSVEIPNFRVLRPSHPETAPRRESPSSYQIRPESNREFPRSLPPLPAPRLQRPAALRENPRKPVGLRLLQHSPRLRPRYPVRRPPQIVRSKRSRPVESFPP